MFEFLKDVGNYDSRKVGRDEINGFTISTAFTSDEGYETAIIDSNGVHPVERYERLNDAEEGHKRWYNKMKDPPKTVTELGGLGGLVDSKETELCK